MPFQLFTLPCCCCWMSSCPSSRWSQPWWSDGLFSTIINTLLCPCTALSLSLRSDSFQRPVVTACAHIPRWCDSSTTYWACPLGLTPLKDQWFQLVGPSFAVIQLVGPTVAVIRMLCWSALPATWTWWAIDSRKNHLKMYSKSKNKFIPKFYWGF